MEVLQFYGGLADELLKPKPNEGFYGSRVVNGLWMGLK